MIDVTNDDRLITVSDARQCFGGCIPGWRRFADKHDFEWQTVVRNGLLASELLATKDAMAITLVEFVYHG